MAKYFSGTRKFNGKTYDLDYRADTKKQRIG
jgi:hypothetical protein